MPHRKRILLSDDNEGFSTLLLESLHEHGGFHVLHAREYYLGIIVTSHKFL